MPSQIEILFHDLHDMQARYIKLPDSPRKAAKKVQLLGQIRALMARIDNYGKRATIVRVDYQIGEESYCIHYTGISPTAAIEYIRIKFPKSTNQSAYPIPVGEPIKKDAL